MRTNPLRRLHELSHHRHDHPLSPRGRPQPTHAGFGSWFTDTAVLVKRNILHIIRTPELLLDVTIQPIMFVLLFRFVFGGAIPIQGTSYVNFLMAGIFVQTIAFAMLWSGVLLANDLQKGLIDRFRSLPMKSWTVLAARTTTDLFRSMLAITIMIAVGLAVGFRPDATLVGWAGAIGILLLFGFALAWIGITLGMTVRTPEARNGRDLHLRLPAHLRQQRLRADRDHAELAGDLHRASADHARDQHGPRLDARSSRRRRCLGRAVLVGRHPGRLLPARPDHVPQAHDGLRRVKG